MQTSSFSMTIQDIVTVTKETLIRCRMDKTISDVSVDTRTLKAGSPFISLSACYLGGYHFLAQAVISGAGVFLEGRAGGRNLLPRVEDTLTVVENIAHCWHSRFHMPVIAIMESLREITMRGMVAACYLRAGKINSENEKKLQRQVWIVSMFSF